ncbi:hypothetical protein TWF225_004729 [Orbilia oligospora]|uniref:Uncharacterized protein n=1 Tax=Orbilia oligospora TaxID=2813651 RepID=A0A7C8K8Q1_ORBOL|nr:hypothetical protein TWF751_009430 [Orbilia oligospora]KAF3186206.1 hypothetical protein TWF225_004729 [Orbilia oligospora]KAF3239676.1 hypothetical protein TWF217_001228 [Orbilia oligospora]KAF3261280.1 hypothetical protein TWF128_003067 [Orbilia oligospora]KAF3287188.1 hypothetical protein TWF132_008709 [Orbilia oligospora]
MDPSSDLQQKLSELDHELEEGEITRKGYEKRRTLLLSQFQGVGSATSSPRASIQSQPHIAYNPHHSVQSINRSAAPSPTPYQQQESPRPNRYSLQVGQAGNYDSRADTMVSAVTANTHFSGGGGGTRSFSQPLQTPQWHQRNHSGSAAPAAQARQASYSYGHQPQGSSSSSQSQYVAYQPPMSDYGGYNNNNGGQGQYDPYYGNQQQQPPMQQPGGQYGYDSRAQTMQEYAYEGTNTMTSTAYFADFSQQNYDPAQQLRPDNYQGNQPYVHRYSGATADPPYSPAANIAPPLLTASDLPPAVVTSHQMPLEPRDVPFDVYDPHNANIPMSKFDNIAAVLRYRMRVNGKQAAYMVLDGKGKEIATCNWDKLGSRAEKVAQVIREKSNLYRGDRVALIYRDIEVIDFAIALLGCFIAGVVAVPVNNPEDHAKLNLILQQTQAHLALTTDNNLKAFQRDLVNQKLQWPRGVEWWKTNEFKSFHSKGEGPALQVPDLAYIEFSRAPTGDLRGVVMDHRTIMHQMSNLSAIISTTGTQQNSKDTFASNLRDRAGKPIAVSNTGETLVTYLDPRQSIGMIMGVLLAVYAGNTTIYCTHSCISTPGLYANIITRYKATLILADYPGLKQVAYNYQQDPYTTRNFSKKQTVDFSPMKMCLIDCLTVDSEFHEILADRWLRPLGNARARDVVAPMLCLPEHGGMLISIRDWLGGEERMGCSLVAEVLNLVDPEKPKESSPGGYSGLIGSDVTKLEDGHRQSDLLEALLDKEALKTNDVVIVAVGAEARKRSSEPGVVRLMAFGYPLPDATLAIVDPENSVLCGPNTIGEIWVDSPSLSGGFWALPKHTETIFHAKPYKFEPENPLPVMLDMEFLRTGLLGCVIEGKVFVLGLYEDRLRQKVEWSEGAADMGMGRAMAEYRYFFVQHIIVSIIKNVPKIYDSSAFDVYVNDEHLPIILLESPAASTSPSSAGGPPRQLDTPLLESIAEKCIEVLLEQHQVRTYCVMITAPNTLPRTWKNGRREIGNMLCRKEFDVGGLPCVYVKFGVERAVLNLPLGADPVGGIWSVEASDQRQAALASNEKQYSGFDYREVVIDDRTSTPLNSFSSIVDLLQWRVSRQAEELSYCTVDTKGKEGKGVTWKKLDQKIAAVAGYLKKKGYKAGEHVILIYTHSEDFVYAVHACFCMGIIVIPMAPLDNNRLSEDVPALLHIIQDYKVRAILVNNDVDSLLKQKSLAQHIKQSANVLKITMPPIHNTAKPPKQNNGCRDMGFTMKPAWVQSKQPAMVWTYWTPDQRSVAVSLSHQTILGICKVQKETCQMTSSRPVFGCVRSTNGLGFVHTCLMGVFVGASTYLVSPLDFGANPLLLFQTLARYKVKDTYATPQMMDHAVSPMTKTGFNLNELKNLMISFESRPRQDLYRKVQLHFATTFLDRFSINTVYSHVLNPMVASRSYMTIEPVELHLDTRALRRGLIYPVEPDTDSTSLLVQDSGMVPVSTQIAIVNPETCRLCHVGEYGEIWASSEANADSFYGSSDAFDAERFNAKTVDGDPRITYVRTGDLGFLHTVNRPVGPQGQMAEMQVLFVLGSLGETFEVNGLSHFPMDIESSVERAHRNVVPGGSAVFQAGGLVVVLIEVYRKSFLASIVPVIVNAILNEHQLVVDIVAFVGQGDFPRSRLGEKQRGKILANWVTRKLRTIAQFGIRDLDATEHAAATMPPPPPQQIGVGESPPAPVQLIEQIQPANMEGYTPPEQTLIGAAHAGLPEEPEVPRLPEPMNAEDFMPIPKSHMDPYGMTATHYGPVPVEMPTSYHEIAEPTPKAVERNSYLGDVKLGELASEGVSSSSPPPKIPQMNPRRRSTYSAQHHPDTPEDETHGGIGGGEDVTTPKAGVENEMKRLSLGLGGTGDMELDTSRRMSGDSDVRNYNYPAEALMYQKLLERDG